jgi:hypothetical protein
MERCQYNTPEGDTSRKYNTHKYSNTEDYLIIVGNLLNNEAKWTREHGMTVKYKE